MSVCVCVCVCIEVGEKVYYEHNQYTHTHLQTPVFCGSTAMLSQHSKTEALLQKYRRPVPVPELDQLRQGTKVAVVHVECFGNNELSSDLLLSWILW